MNPLVVQISNWMNEWRQVRLLIWSEVCFFFEVDLFVAVLSALVASITSPQNGMEPAMLKGLEIQPYYNQTTYTSCEPPVAPGALPPPSTVIAHLTNGEPPPSSLSPHNRHKRIKRNILPSVDDDVENVGNGQGGATGNEHDSSTTAATGHPGDSYYGKSPSHSHSMIGVGPPTWGAQQPVTADHPPPPPPPHPSLDPTRWRHPPFIGAETHHTMAAPPHLMWEGGWQPPY